MSRAVLCGSAFGLGTMMFLQGCGHDNSNSKPAPEVTTGTTTMMLTTTTTTGPAGRLPECQDISTFYKISYVKDTEHATGQCLPSKSPGAYYTKPGEKDKDGKSDRLWMCFTAKFDPGRWTDEAAKAMKPQPYEGACLFRRYNSSITPDAVNDCSEYLPHHPAKCSPGPSMYWGACWSSHSENWTCIAHRDPTIPGLAKGDCTAQVVPQADNKSPFTKYFFDGACRFRNETSQTYKCDTVPGYSEGYGGTCGQAVAKWADQACFSVKPDVNWQCIAKGRKPLAPCEWTSMPIGSPNLYTGYCVFPGNPQYADAVPLTLSNVMV